MLALPASAGRSLHLPTFWLKRVLRLYPAYWFAIALSLALMLVHDPARLQGLSEWIQSFWRNPVPTSEVVKTLMMAGPGFNTRLINPPVWSLLIEMSVSLVLPFFIIAFQRWTGIVKWGAVVLGAATLIFALDRFRTLDLFLLGTVLAFTYQPLLARLRSWSTPAKAVLLAVAVGLYGVMNLGLPADFALIREVQAAGSVLLMLLAMGSRRLNTLLSRPVPQFLGEVSYSLYLLHFPIMLATASVLYPVTGIYVVWVVTLTLSLGLAYAVYRGIELPFIRLCQRLRFPTRSVPAQA